MQTAACFEAFGNIHMLNEAKGMSSRADPSSCTAPEVRAPPRTHLIKAPHRLKTNAIFLSSLYKRIFCAR